VGRRPRGPAKRRGLVGALVTAIALAGVLGAGSAVAAGWVAPLPGPLSVSHAFEAPTTVYGAGHRGVDLRGTTGEPVRAAGPGRVSYAGLLAGRGVVVVQHAAGLRTTYEPVSATVRVGQSIGSGAPLGRLAIGHAGCPGTCLHWGLLRGQTYLDPLSLLGTTHVRLLPSGTTVAGGSSPVAGGPGPVRPEATQLSGTTRPAPGRPVVRVRPAAAPRLTLRSADRPWGLAALVALVLGLGLLVLPGPPRPRPAQRRPPPRPRAPAGRALPLPIRAPAQGRELVDLGRERARRRAG